MKTLVFGASLKPQRYANRAIHALVSNNVPVVAYGLRNGAVAGVEIDTELVDYQDIDTITLYLNPTRQKEYYQYLIQLGPKRIIFNPGTENPEFQEVLIEKGIQFENACTLVMLSIGNY